MKNSVLRILIKQHFLVYVVSYLCHSKIRYFSVKREDRASYWLLSMYSPIVRTVLRLKFWTLSGISLKSGIFIGFFVAFNIPRIRITVRFSLGLGLLRLTPRFRFSLRLRHRLSFKPRLKLWFTFRFSVWFTLISEWSTSKLYSFFSEINLENQFPWKRSAFVCYGT